MPQAPQTFLNWFLPIATLLLGYIAKSVTDGIDSRRASKREQIVREESRRDHLFERRTDFQRQTLLDLQEATMQLMRATAAINHEDVMAFRKTGKWGMQLVGDELSEAHRLANARVTILRVRVRDQTVRDFVGDVQANGSSLVICRSEQESTRLMGTLFGAFDNLNGRIGELLRHIDDEG
ncbi:hypothetical protein [Candidatus Binatus soli]|jgi:hypothetical protein|uniref:hypothetical protein n=1 Tax=Candidatus Binatus soli TaxID=1953413 RepID=UPI003D0A0B10